MENLNLYYSREMFSDTGKKKKYFALPIKEILIDIYIDRKKLNLYQEIILELYAVFIIGSANSPTPFPDLLLCDLPGIT